MKKMICMALCILFVLTASSCQREQQEILNQQVRIKLIPIETTVKDGTVTMSANLRVTNLYGVPLENVVARVDQATGLSVSPTNIKIGNVGALASILTKERVTVSYPAPSQDAAKPERRLKWDIDYAISKKLEKSYPSKDVFKKPKERRALLGLHISEIMFFPKDPKKGHEWIEFYNDSDKKVNIAGYEIRNSTRTVYRFPEEFPSVPPRAFILVLFDGKSSAEDDLSFDGDALATLHVKQRNVFSDSGDICAIFSGKPYLETTMRGFVSWGDAGKAFKGHAFTRHAAKMGMWKKGAPIVYAGRPMIEGPAAFVSRGGSLVLRRGKGLRGDLIAVPCRTLETTPGKSNVLPAPQPYLPHDNLHTSADLFTFSWIPIEGALYHFQIAKDPSFSAPIINTQKLKTAYFRPPSRLARNVLFYWRVRAISKGKKSAWSEARTFIADSPERGRAEGAPPLIEEGAPNPLGVPNQPARKDSSLLCLDGCDAAHWDSSNAAGPQHGHSTWYCWAAAAQMLAWYYGGDLLQDEIVVTVKGNLTSPTQPSPNLPHGVDPEDSLPHGGHASAPHEHGLHSLRYALQATNDELNIQYVRPTAEELEGFIDDGRPLRYSTGGHAMVVDGYRTTAGGVFQGRFLNTDNDGTIEWREWATEPFSWCAVPDDDVTGEDGDIRMSADSDGDGMVNFDEDERFPTDDGYPDTEWDGVNDKSDIVSYVFRAIVADVDGDGIRGEVDPDSDNGGLQDGLEDLDQDGEHEPGNDETDPHDPADENLVDIDLVLAIDTTGSMTDDIAAAQEAAGEIVDAVDAGAGSYRIAVVSFEDFPESPYGNAGCGDFMYHDVLNFSDDKDAIVDAINSLELRCGADWPESHYSALMHCFDQDALGGWRNGVVKTAILMSDAPPHDPEPNTGYVAADVVQAALNLDPAVISPILIGGDVTARGYYESLSSGTGGMIHEAADATEVVDVILEKIDTFFTSPVTLPGGPYSVCPGSDILFDASASYDRNGKVALYEWDFNDDGIYDVRTSEPFTIFQYRSNYSGVARLRVHDYSGLFNTAFAHVNVGDTTPPQVTITKPEISATVKDVVTLVAEAIDNNKVATVSFSVRKPYGAYGRSIRYEDLPAKFNKRSGTWECKFDTKKVPSGNYIIVARAMDIYKNESVSELVLCRIR